MAYLEISGRRHTIVIGELRVGSDASCQLVLSAQGVAPVHAVVQGFPDGQVAIRRAKDDLEVLINGVRLGPQPTPLLHGDKVQLGGQELLFVDERRSGSTQYVAAVDPGLLSSAKPKAGKAGQVTGSTGGRVVSLTDGREYSFAGASMVFGREAGCDVVITDKNVSRRHCEIMATPKGYVLVDSSTNGSFVNGERIEGQRVLARADVIRVGSDEFRFYADMVPTPPSAPPAGGSTEDSGSAPPRSAASPPAPPVGPQAAQSAAPSAAAAPAAAPVAAPPGAERRLAHTLAGVPGQAPPMPASRSGEDLAEETLREGAAARSAAAGAGGAGGVLANVLVRSGPLKGQRLPIRVPIVNVGRADYNDVVLQDDSVSTTHAKLQRREGVWVLVDLESTNGTFVDGEKVQGETPLAPGALIRFGDVQSMWEPIDDTVDAAKGASTKVMGAIKAPPPKATPPPAAPKPPTAAAVAERPTTPAPKAPAAAQPSRRPAPRPKTPEPAAGGSPKWVVPVVVVTVIVIVIVGFLLIR